MVNQTTTSTTSMQTHNRRQVRFSDEIVTITFKRQRNSESRWISRQHLQKLSKNVHGDAEECKRKMPHTDEELSRIFDIPVRERIDLLVRLNSQNDEEEEDCIRGLERHVSANHRTRIRGIQQESIIAVLSLQEQLKAAGAKPDALQEELATVSDEMTRNARVFARLLGLSDQRVIQELQLQQQQQPPHRKSSASSNVVPKRRISDLLKRHSYTAVVRQSFRGRKQRKPQQVKDASSSSMLLPMPTMALTSCNYSAAA
ncbi:expressed unknown protein [Seminavis robusta]|uniref:Uncharacterized protein n=1 Tax=Seminavis robusta TaxID=568900 RepID=A0A9N8H5D8_9STRA|nr:expressed unknown protein [Seminavis robusta]|eukprot:Sro111_g055340.1 n/a (258) ;mRNA; r:68727-69500